jgi:hypothetical protein
MVGFGMSDTQIIIKHARAFADITVQWHNWSAATATTGAEPVGHGLNKRAQIRWIQLYELKFAEGSEIVVNLGLNN